MEQKAVEGSPLSLSDVHLLPWISWSWFSCHSFWDGHHDPYSQAFRLGLSDALSSKRADHGTSQPPQPPELILQHISCTHLDVSFGLFLWRTLTMQGWRLDRRKSNVHHASDMLPVSWQKDRSFKYNSNIPGIHQLVSPRGSCYINTYILFI